MSPVQTQISSAPSIPNHPVTAGRRGAALFALWCLLQLAQFAVMAWLIAFVMREVEHSTLDNATIAIAAAGFLGVFAVVRVVSRRVLHLAWGEVPGAFSWRSVLRGDSLESCAPALPTLVWEVLNAAATISIGVWLVSLDDVGAPIRGVTVLGLGALTVGHWVVRMIAEWNTRRRQHWIRRFDVVTLASMLVWVILGAVILDSTPMSSPELLLLGLILGAAATVTAKVVTARL